MSPNSESLATSAIPISGQPSTSKGEQRHVDKTAMSRRRASSNSSASSAMSPGFKSETEDQFVFSPHQAPPHEPSSFFPPTHPRGPSSLVTPLATGSNHSGVGKYKICFCHTSINSVVVGRSLGTHGRCMSTTTPALANVFCLFEHSGPAYRRHCHRQNCSTALEFALQTLWHFGGALLLRSPLAGCGKCGQ